MIIKFFNNFVVLFFFYLFLLKLNIFRFLKYQFLFLMPKIFNFFIKTYEKNFLFFYIVDNFLSTLFFLYMITIGLEIIFPIVGVVYNEILFEENLI